jgi:hypothetical protein
MTMERTLVMAPDASDEDLLDRIRDSIDDLADAELYYTDAEEPNEDVLILHWISGDATDKLRVVLDEHTPARYLTIVMRDAQQAKRVADALTAALPVLDRGALLADAKKASRGALKRLALGIARPDPDAVAAFTAGLAHSDPQVRADAAGGIALASWDELHDAVEKALETERDPGTRRVLEYAAMKTRD